MPKARAVTTSFARVLFTASSSAVFHCSTTAWSASVAVGNSPNTSASHNVTPRIELACKPMTLPFV